MFNHHEDTYLGLIFIHEFKDKLAMILKVKMYL
jgi:hypothetical protein